MMPIVTGITYHSTTTTPLKYCNCKTGTCLKCNPYFYQSRTLFCMSESQNPLPFPNQVKLPNPTLFLYTTAFTFNFKTFKLSNQTLFPNATVFTFNYNDIITPKTRST